MGQEYQYVCDGCGDVVHGKVKATFVHKDYFQIKGSVILQMMDTKTRFREHIFVTKPPSEELTFCQSAGLECLASYIKMKKDKFLFNKRLRLSEQAEQEQLKREGVLPVKPAEFIVGTKKDHSRSSYG